MRVQKSKFVAAWLAIVLAAIVSPGFAASKIPLVEAAEKGDLATVSKLLESRVDANSHGPGGFTALIFAANGNLPMVKLLVEHHADVNFNGNRKRWTPLQVAAAGLDSNPDIVRYLLAHGAEVNRENIDGETALQMTVANEKGLETEIALLEHGAVGGVVFRARSFEDAPNRPHTTPQWVQYARGLGYALDTSSIRHIGPLTFFVVRFREWESRGQAPAAKPAPDQLDEWAFNCATGDEYEWSDERISASHLVKLGDGHNTYEFGPVCER